MLDSLFTSKMRVQILMRLFLNASNGNSLRELLNEFDASSGYLNTVATGHAYGKTQVWRRWEGPL